MPDELGSGLKRVLVLLGTRPEAIKLAPVIRALRADPARFVCRVCSTGQHREMVTQALEVFGIELDVEMDAMASATSLGQLTARLIKDVDALLEAERPDWLLVQGDTTSAMAGALCGYYRRVRIGHVEAGLRTGDRWAPFPEEVNRTLIARIADLNFAPTSRAAANLHAEGVAPASIHVTGNTIVDALEWIGAEVAQRRPAELDASVQAMLDGHRMALVTCHRRESFGGALENVCRALRQIVDEFPDLTLVFPVHMNPSVYGPVHQMLGGQPRIKLLEPIGYTSMVWLLRNCYCIFTDSGGIQEEAPSFGKPVLVMRTATERPELIEAGCGRLVGTDAHQIAAGARQLLSDRALYDSMATAENPFGDGHAAEYIVAQLAKTA